MRSFRVGFFVLVLCRLGFGLDSLTLAELQTIAKQQQRSFEIPLPPADKIELRTITTSASGVLKRAIARVRESSPDSHGFAAVVENLDRALYHHAVALAKVQLTLFADKETPLYKVALRCQLKLQEEYSNVTLDPDLYRKVKAYEATVADDPERKRLLEVVLSIFAFDGQKMKALLDSWEVKGLMAELSKREAEFYELYDQNSKLSLRREDLEGVGEDFLASLEQENGEYLLDTHEWWHWDRVMRFCSNAETRAKFWATRHGSAAPQSQALVRSILAGRLRIARRLGYGSWAVYGIQSLSTSPRSLLAQFRSLREKTDKDFNREKREIARILGHAPRISDITYARQKKNEELGLDEKEIRSYFPYARVMEGLFAYVERVFGIRTVKISDAPDRAGCETFALFDKKTERFIGNFRVDPFASKAKDSSWFALSFGSTIDEKGVSRRGFVQVHLNLQPPTEGLPTLLTMEEVWTIFHEFGHTLHYLSAEQRYYSLGPDTTNADILEFPSTLLERMAWEPDVLREFARHWQTGELPPESLLQKLHASQLVFKAHMIREAAARSVLDLKLHASRPPVHEQAEKGYFAEYYYPLPEGTSFVASNAYFIGGYDAAYWSYPWAEGLADAVMQRFEASPDRYFDTGEASHFRKQFLEQGARQSGSQLILQTLEKPFRLCPALLNRVKNSRGE